MANGTPISTDKQLAAFKRGNEHRLHNAWINCLSIAMYFGCFVVAILALSVLGGVLFLSWHYCQMLSQDQVKLDAAMTHAFSFIFGGSTISIVVHFMKKK